MGNIRSYEAQVDPRGQLAGGADAEDFGAGVGRGLRAIGAGVGRLADRLEKQQEQQELSDAATSSYADALQLEKDYQQAITQAQPGDLNFGERWEQHVTDFYSQRADKYTSPAARDYQSRSAARSTNQFATRGYGAQAVLNTEKLKLDVEQGTEAVSQLVFANPESYGDRKAQVRDNAAQGVGVFAYGTPTQRAQASDAMQEQAAWNAGLGVIARAKDPLTGKGSIETFLSDVAPGALNPNEDWRGNMNPSSKRYDWFNDLPPEKRMQLVTKARGEYMQGVRIKAQNMNRLLEDQRAELQLNGRVRNELPRSAFSVLGADADRTYTRYRGEVKAYGLAHDLLNLDPAQAVRQIEALKPSPGAADFDPKADAYNLARNAYADLRRQLDKDPVGTALQRNMPGMQQLTSLDDQDVAQQLALRLPAARDLARQAGRTTLLSNGEADAVRDKLRGLGDRELRSHFLTMRGVLNKPAEYQAYVRQVYNDNPAATNGAALLGKGGMTVTVDGANWTSDAVATRILSGSRFMERKGEESKGVKAAVTVSDEKFRKAFQEAVGASIPPYAYESALETTKAFYIGDAMYNGRGLGELDPAAVKRATRLALGERTRQGGGEVYLPWGMTPDRFRQEAAARYDVLRKQHGLTTDFENLDLVPLPGREAAYQVRMGNAPTGYVIDLSKPAGAGSTGISDGWDAGGEW